MDHSLHRQTLRADKPLELTLARLPQFALADVPLCQQTYCKERAFQTGCNGAEAGEFPTHVNQALPIDRQRTDAVSTVRDILAYQQSPETARLIQLGWQNGHPRNPPVSAIRNLFRTCIEAVPL